MHSRILFELRNGLLESSLFRKLFINYLKSAEDYPSEKWSSCKQYLQATLHQTHFATPLYKN
jgi:hypothetical protein